MQRLAPTRELQRHRQILPCFDDAVQGIFSYLGLSNDIEKPDELNEREY